MSVGSESGQLHEQVRRAVATLADLLFGSGRGLTEQIGDRLLICRGSSDFHGARIQVIGPLSADGVTLRMMRRTSGEFAREHICFCYLPTFEHKLRLPLDDNYNDGTLIPIYPDDLNALSSKQINILDLYEYKLFRRAFLDKSDAETVFDNASFSQFQATKNSSVCHFEELSDSSGSQFYDAENESWVQHPLSLEIVQHLGAGRASLLVGLSSSGKSVLALQVAHLRADRGDKVWYLNLSRQSGYVANLFDIIRNSSGDAAVLVVLDDLQSDPSCARFALTLISTWRRVATAKSANLLAVCWKDFSAQAVKWFENFKLASVSAEMIRDKLANEARHVTKGEVVDALVESYGEDLLLLGLFLNEAKRSGAIPAPDAIADQIWKSRTRRLNQEDARVTALIVGSLGRFDIAAPQIFVLRQAGLEPARLSEFIQAGLVRRADKLLSFGHRSLCGFLCDWLGAQGAWASLKTRSGLDGTSAVMLEYLQSCDAEAALSALRGLQARVGFKDEGQLNVRAAMITELWDAFCSIIARLEYQQHFDATWGRVPSSATFASLALSELGKFDLSERSIQFLQSVWRVHKGRISVRLDQLATRDDFQKIREGMIEEDQLSSRWVGTAQSAESLDIERFHRTWVYGLILGAEARASRPVLPLPRLAELVEREALPSGAFYPERVPWCTARVLLGLAECSRTIDTSPAVRSAVEWLTRESSNGGALEHGIWNSGTGPWNRDLETTAMVLVALSAVGFDMKSPRLSVAKSFLVSNRAKWTESGKEIDGAMAIQAYLEMGGSWNDVAMDVHRLSQWARGEAIWQKATKSSKETLEQSCRVAQIASHLIDIGWTAIQNDLPAFLDALRTPQVLDAPVEVPTAVLSPEPGVGEIDEALAFIDELKTVPLRQSTVVGDCRIYDEHVRNTLKDCVLQIRTPLEQKNTSHENFLIWAAPGSGKSFVISETARSLASTVRYIEINFAKHSTEMISERLRQIETVTQPILVLFDEIAALPQYDGIFSLLDINADDLNRRAVFVSIDGSGTGLESLISTIAGKFKGPDLLRRTPPTNRFEVPSLGLGDQIVVFATQVGLAAESRTVSVTEIEKLALYYLLKSGEYQAASAVRDLAHSAVGRMEATETRLRFDHLFRSSERKREKFWTEHAGIVTDLNYKFLWLD